jgi:hypothetical protein
VRNIRRNDKKVAFANFIGALVQDMPQSAFTDINNLDIFMPMFVPIAIIEISNEKRQFIPIVDDSWHWNVSVFLLIKITVIRKATLLRKFFLFSIGAYILFCPKEKG